MIRIASRMMLLGFALTLLLGCEKGGFTSFNMDYESTIIIQNGLGISTPVSFNTPEIESNSESEFEVNDTRKDKIQHINLSSLNLEITAPANQEFDFIEDIELFISADGLDEILLAYTYNIENSVGNTLVLTCSQNDFQEYIKKDKFKLRLRTMTDEYNLNDVEIKIKGKFRVDAKLIGKA